jgi:adenine nucleotide transporter 17
MKSGVHGFPGSYDSNTKRSALVIVNSLSSSAMSSGGEVSAVPPIGHAVGGAIGSALALLLFYPLERARIEMQADAASMKRPDELTVPVEEDVTRQPVQGERPMEDGNMSESSSEASWVSCVGPDDNETSTQPLAISTTQPLAISTRGTDNKGLVPTLAQLYDRKELYKGARSVVITLATSSFVFFYSHQALQELFVRKQAKISPGRSLLGTCLAGMINVLVTNPMWVANMRIIKGSAPQKSLFKEMRNIVQSEGWPYLWNGTGASLLLVSNPVLQFFVYEQAKASRLKARATLSPVEAFCVGALAKAVATIATYPLQLAQVLLRLQPKGVGTWGCLKEQVDRGGVRALYTGINAKLLQTVLTAAFTFLTYEQILGVVRAALLVRKREQRQKLNEASNM